MDWLLMNRDTPLLYFCSSIDLYGDTLVQEKAWLSPLRPLGYPGLWKFLTRRRASTHRKNMGRLLADCGCRTLEGFLRITHAASLNDTFWVKEADSPLCWAEVSLYANAFDPDIAGAALTGSPTPAVLSAPRVHHRRALSQMLAAGQGRHPSVQGRRQRRRAGSPVRSAVRPAGRPFVPRFCGLPAEYLPGAAGLPVPPVHLGGGGFLSSGPCRAGNAHRFPAAGMVFPGRLRG